MRTKLVMLFLTSIIVAAAQAQVAIAVPVGNCPDTEAYGNGQQPDCAQSAVYYFTAPVIPGTTNPSLYCATCKVSTASPNTYTTAFQRVDDQPASSPNNIFREFCSEVRDNIRTPCEALSAGTDCNPVSDVCEMHTSCFNAFKCNANGGTPNAYCPSALLFTEGGADLGKDAEIFRRNIMALAPGIGPAGAAERAILNLATVATRFSVYLPVSTAEYWRALAAASYNPAVALRLIGAGSASMHPPTLRGDERFEAYLDGVFAAISRNGM